MNGPDHYREAQRLAGEDGEWYYADPDRVPAILARAQVHATLALVAATATAGRLSGKGAQAWDKAVIS